MPSDAIWRESSVVASRWVKVVNGAGSVKSSAGTYTACRDVIERPLVELMRSWSSPIPSASVGWYPTAEGLRLVHLAVDEGRLVEDARLLHLQPEVVALTRALAHAREHRHAAVLGGDPVDHLQDHDGLADAGATEHADLAALHVGREEVDDLD